MNWTMKHPRSSLDMLGYVPSFLSESDPRSAEEQINANYPFGGFQPFDGFKMLKNGNLAYSGDPETILLAEAKLRDETIRFYQNSWLAIVQPDGSFKVARID